MVPRGLTEGNSQLTRQNEIVYCLTRKTLRCNSLVQKICMFHQKGTSHCKNSLPLGPQEPKHCPPRWNHLDALRGLIPTKRFHPRASTKRAQLSVAATTVRLTDLFNIMSSPESMLIRQD